MRKLFIGLILVSLHFTIIAQITPGTIAFSQTQGNQLVLCHGSASEAMIQTEAPSGGTGALTFIWRRSNDYGGSWTTISFRTGMVVPANYTPPVLVHDAWFRRDVTDGVTIAEGNTLFIWVKHVLDGGTIGYDQAICYGATPGTVIQLNAASGGYEYGNNQWQISTNSINWSTISDTYGDNYTPPALYADTWYRRIRVDGGCGTITSNVVKITVGSQLGQAQLHDNVTINGNSGSTNLNISISGGISPYTVNYTRNTVAQAPVTGYSSGSNISTGTLSLGTYTYVLTSVTDAAGCSAQNLGTPITVIVGPPSGKALVMVNSTSAYYNDYLNYVKPYLDNFGIPYDVWNVSGSETFDFSNYSVIIFGHNRVYESGYPLTNLYNALNQGVGLYSFDPHLFDTNSNFSLTGSYSPVTSNQILINVYPTVHYITQLHHDNGTNFADNTVNLRSSWSLTQTSSLISGTDLATMTDGTNTVSLLQVANYGLGRIVKWSGYNWMYENILGPVYGMDDLIWRGIVWAARKPFVMQGMPPMITMRVDDVYGDDGYPANPSVADNFQWITICNNYGIKPWCGIFTSSLANAPAPDHIALLRNLINSGNATASPHARASDLNEYIYYDPIGDGIIKPAERVADAVTFMITNNLPISKYLVAHSYRIASEALPGISNQTTGLGIEFIGIHQLPDANYYSASWLNCGPYRKSPRNGIANEEQNPPVSYSRPVYYGDYVHWDYSGTTYNFFNCVTEVRDEVGYDWTPTNHPAFQAENGIKTLRRALNSMVLTTLFTHEYQMGVIHDFVTPENFDASIHQITDAINNEYQTPLYPYMYPTLDQAIQYVRAKYNMKITNVTSNTSTISVSYSGNNDMNTICYLFTETGGVISYQFGTLTQITTGDGTRTLSFSK